VNGESRLSRRTLLVGVVAGVGGLGAGALVADRLGLLDVDSGGEHSEDHSAIERIGATYLVDHPEEASAAVLAGLLPEGWLGADGRDLSALRERVKEDFAAGDVVPVDGWVLSRTAARAAGLLSLG
jgi:hypothetical protein